jgi:hypothetical protein
MTVAPPRGRGLALAARALAMQRAALKTILSYPHPNRGFLEYTGGEIRITLLHGTCVRLNAVQDITPASQRVLAEFRAAATVYMLEYFDGWARDIKTNPGDLFSFNAEMLYTLSAIASFATDLGSFTVMRDHLFHTWIGAFDPSWERVGTLWMQAGLRQSQLMLELLGAEGDVRRLNHYSDEAFNKGLKPIAHDLNHSSHPVMRMYGFVAAALADPERLEKTPAQVEETRQAFMRLFETTLSANGPATQQTRQYAYIAAVDGMNLLPKGTRSDTETTIDFLNLALRRKEVIPYITLKLLFEGASPSSSGAPREWLDVLERTLDLSRATDSNGLDGNADGLRQMLTEEIRDLRQRYPELGPAKVTRPWESVRRLADIDSLPGITRFEEFPQVAGDQVCFLGSGKDAAGKFFLQAFEVALAGGPPRALGLINVEPLRPAGNGYWPVDGFVYRLIQGGAVDDRNYYVSVRGGGVLVFPRDGTPASRINKNTGLPSDWARSLVAKDGYLYVVSSADDGAYLTKWNPKDKTSDVCISSLRKEARSPLDDIPGIRLRFMVDDTPRKRLLLGIGQQGERAGMRWDECRGGLWQLDTTNGELQRLLTTATGLHLGHARGIDHDSLFTANTLWVVQYDLETSVARYASFKPNMVPDEYIREMSIGEKTIKGAGWAEPDTERAGTRRVIERWLWLGEPFSRISADARTVELLDAQLMPNAQPIGPVWTMEPIGANRLILGDIRQLYLATLHNPSDETPGVHVNLMPLIDVEKDQVSGGWQMDGGRLTTDGQDAARMNVPYEPPEEYDFHIEFIRTAGVGDVCQILSHAGKQFVWTMGAYGTCHFFANIGGTYVENNPTRVKSTTLASNGQKHHCVVKVRKGSVSSYLDGSLVAYHETDYSDFSMPGGWHLEKGALGVAAWWSATQFNRIELVEVTGHGKPIAHVNPGVVRMANLFEADFIAPPRLPSGPTTTPATPIAPFLPTSADQAKARTKFKETYAIQLTDRTRHARQALADQLIEAAGNAAPRSADKFVLLMAARQCAINELDLTRAVASIDALGSAYDVNTLQLMLDTMLHIGGRANSAAEGAENCRAGLKLLNQLLAAGDIEAALAAGAVLKSVAVFDPMFSLIVQQRVKEVQATHVTLKEKLPKGDTAVTPLRIVDVLSMADAQAGAVHGNWTRTKGGLASDASKARFEFPYRPPAEYLVRVEFTRLSGNDGIDICVAKGSGSACWTAGGWGNTLCTFQAADGFPQTDNSIRTLDWIQNGQRMVSCFEVRNGIIRGYLNGELLSERKTNLQDMHDPHIETHARDISRLAITSWDCPTVFHRVEVLELSGHGETLR